jgi:hypothetical protein
MNGGNPTAGADKAQVDGYTVGTQPDPNWRSSDAFTIGQNKSPNGVTEYKSSLFGGSLKGKLLVVHYSNDNDLFAYDVNPDGTINGTTPQVVRGAEDFIDPLDVVEDPDTGNLYVSQYDQLGADVPKVFLMRATTSTQPSTDCAPLSTLACSQVKVPTAPAYKPATGGLVDKDGQGTGFTMVQPNGPGGTTPAYKPEDLDATTGRLTITARNGIQFKVPDTTPGENLLENAVGVGVDGGRKLRLETTVVNPFLAAGSGSEQGGLWLGPDQDHYVKLVVANAGGYHRVQLLREAGGASVAPADEVNLPASNTGTNYSSDRVRLILEADRRPTSPRPGSRSAPAPSSAWVS